MPIRVATWSDLLALSHIAAVAFYDDTFFGPVLHPRRHLYPFDLYLHLLRSLREDFLKPENTILVAYAEKPASTSPTNTSGDKSGSAYSNSSSSNSSNDAGPITGGCIWSRRGRALTILRRNQPWLQWLALKCMPYVNQIHSIFYPDRAIDNSKRGLVRRALEFTKHYFESPPRRKEIWFLGLCFTDPEARGMGYARELVAWGVERARRECVVAGLTAAIGTEGFYRKCGFGEPVGRIGEGEGNPARDVPGGAIMFVEDHCVE